MARIGTILLVAGIGVLVFGGRAVAQCRSGGGAGQGGTGSLGTGLGLVNSGGFVGTQNAYAQQMILAQLQQQYLLQQQMLAQQQYQRAQQQAAERQATLATRTARAEQMRTQIAAKRQADKEKRLAANAAAGRSPAALLASYRPGQ